MAQPPPPPPTASSDQEVHISRDGKVIGAFPASTIRQKLISGELRVSDYCWYEGADGWMRLISEPPDPTPNYPYIGDDRPFYFIKDGLLYGPRSSAEIDALVAAEWLGTENLVTCLGADQWWTVEELMSLANEDDDAESDEEGALAPSEVAREPGFDWISHGIRAYAGDPVSGAELGIHAVKRAFAWIADAAETPVKPIQPSSHGDGEQAHCRTCGTTILPATFKLNGGRCFRCNPRKKNR